MLISAFSTLCNSSIVFAIEFERDEVYPSGYSIEIEYQPSSSEISAGDLLTLSWSISNNEDFALSNLYLTDNLPPECPVVSSDILIGERPISFYFSGPLSDQILPGYDSYRWVIDFPHEPDSLANSLPPGSTLTLRYDVLFENPGQYELPLHTICFYGDSTGFFALGEPVSITVHPANEIPTLTEWGLILLILVLTATVTAAIVHESIDVRA